MSVASIATNTDFRQKSFEDSRFIRFCREQKDEKRLQSEEFQSEIKNHLVKNIISNVLKKHSKVTKSSERCHLNNHSNSSSQCDSDWKKPMGNRRVDMQEGNREKLMKDSILKQTRSNVSSKNTAFERHSDTSRSLQFAGKDNSEVERDYTPHELERKVASVDLTRTKDSTRISGVLSEKISNHQPAKRQSEMSKEAMSKEEFRYPGKNSKFLVSTRDKFKSVNHNKLSNSVCFGRSANPSKPLIRPARNTGTDLLITVNGVAKTVNCSGHMTSEARSTKPRKI